MATDELTYEPKKREYVPAGDYLAQLINVTAVDNQFAKDNQDTKQYQLEFVLHDSEKRPIQDSDGSLHKQFAWMGRVLGYKKDGTPYKTQAWSEAILGQKLDPTEPFYFGDLVDHWCWLKIDDTKADGVTPSNKVDKIKPMNGVKKEFFNASRDQDRADESELLMGYSKAKVAVNERGITAQTIDERVAVIAGDHKHFNNQPRGMQLDILKHLQAWAADEKGATYDDKGEEIGF